MSPAKFTINPACLSFRKQENLQEIDFKANKPCITPAMFKPRTL
jgi:hypothetical protein